VIKTSNQETRSGREQTVEARKVRPNRRLEKLKGRRDLL
jgi:hypothetical protein